VPGRVCSLGAVLVLSRWQRLASGLRARLAAGALVRAPSVTQPVDGWEPRAPDSSSARLPRGEAPHGHDFWKSAHR